MPLTRGWGVAARVLLSASAIVIYAALPAVLPAAPSPSRTVLLVGGALFAPVWLWFWWRAVDSRRPFEAPTALTLVVVLLAVLTYAAPPGRDGLLLAALAAGAGLGPRRAAAAVVAISLLAGYLQVLHSETPLAAAATAVNDLVVGAAGIGGRLLLETSLELSRARDEVARLAVDEERLRLARDLHDLLGQDLTLTVMKSELVARDLPADTPPRVRDLQAEVTRGLRRALDDMRAVVVGFRSGGLEAELRAAASALGAAGISLTLEGEVDGLSPAAAAALAWALRESVTNVLRHSGARSCVVRLGRRRGAALMEVEDDGRGDSGSTAGSGLRGIAERVEAAGGSFSAGGRPEGGYRVRATVPVGGRRS